MLPIISLSTPDVPTVKPSLMGAEFATLSPTTFKSSEFPVFFDALVVARRDDGPEDMLELTLCWTSAIVEGRRNRSHSF
jgi:hypothetical protein